MATVYSYMRINTEGKYEPNTYTRQKKALKAYANKSKIAYDTIRVCQEDGSAETFSNRPEWSKLQRLLREGDSLIMLDIACFTRDNNSSSFSQYWWLLEHKIETVFIDTPVLCSTYIEELYARLMKNYAISGEEQFKKIVKTLFELEVPRTIKCWDERFHHIPSGVDKKNPGRITGSVAKLEPPLRKDIDTYLYDRPNAKTAKEIAADNQISPNTFTKYKKIIIAEKEKEKMDSQKQQ